jgi:hypothetical protein
MKKVLIADFDGCIIQEKCDRIERPVSQCIIQINNRIPVMIVTARATPKSIGEAIKMLAAAELSHLPIFFRDVNLFDNSPDGLIAYKANVIQSITAKQLIPIFGIGDNATDDQAYKRSHVEHIIRIRWGEALDVLSGSHVIDIKANNLALAWEQISTYIEGVDIQNEHRRA